MKDTGKRRTEDSGSSTIINQCKPILHVKPQDTEPNSKQQGAELNQNKEKGTVKKKPSIPESGEEEKKE